MEFVSLHHHSTYSFLDGYGHPKEHVARAAELGMTGLALTEHGNLSSHPKLEIAAKEAGIHPIYGCELYCGEGEVKRKNHLSVWAEDQEGYRNLMRMVSWAWTPSKEGGGFYYEPTVSGSVFKEHAEGLIVGSGCTGSLLATSLVGGKNIEPADASFPRGLAVARRFRDLLGASYYLEVQAFPELSDSTCRINPQLEEISKRLKIPLVATADVHYCRPEESDMQVILHSVRPGSSRSFEEQERSWGYHIKLTHPTSDREIYKRLLATGLSKKAAESAVRNSAEIAERCQVELPKASPLQFPIPEGVDRRGYWIDQLRDGWRYRRISEKKNRDEYATRLAYEVSIIEGKDFIDYFLIVSDMTKWTKDNNIFIGPARGSAAASLVCYLLRITEVDPLLFPDLIFERFIDVTRTDLPDIDLDFDDRRRHEVFEYLKGKYGSDYFNMLGTFTTYKSKSCLDDIGKVFRVPKNEVETVKELLIERSSGDARASATIEDTVAMFENAREIFERNPDLYKATRLEGMVKGMGRHAAGAIVSSTKLTETTAIYGNTVSVDKYDAEYLGLLKMDVLGLSTCGMLAEAMEIMGKPITFVYDMPLDDPETIEGFRRNDVVGIFQFDGRAMRMVNGYLKPDNFYEVCVVNALARPGPLHNNAMADYTAIKFGEREPDLKHPIYDEITANTRGQVVYQEQVLRIVREVGGFDWTHAAYIRKIITRKLGDAEFNLQWKRFWKGAKERKISRAVADDIWGTCITAGSYAFNAAHSVSYGMIGWWSMWLKVHRPEVFYLASLRRLPDTKHLDLMRDAARHGIKILPPDVRKSKEGWELEDGALRAGLDSLPKVGGALAREIIRHREEVEPLATWEDLIRVKGIGPSTMNLIRAFVYAKDPLGVHILDRTLRKVIKEIRKGIRVNGSRLPRPTHTIDEIPFGTGKDEEVVWIGVVKDRNLRDLFEVNMARTGVPLDPETVRDPDKREWCMLYGTDGDDVLTMRIDRWNYPRFREAVWNLVPGRDLVLVKGVKRGSTSYRAVEVKEMWVLDPS
jgi:DNA polymerase-3 subunit alpha